MRLDGIGRFLPQRVFVNCAIFDSAGAVNLWTKIHKPRTRMAYSSPIIFSAYAKQYWFEARIPQGSSSNFLNIFDFYDHAHGAVRYDDGWEKLQPRRMRNTPTQFLIFSILNLSATTTTTTTVKIHDYTATKTTGRYPFRTVAGSPGSWRQRK